VHETADNSKTILATNPGYQRNRLLKNRGVALDIERSNREVPPNSGEAWVRVPAESAMLAAGEIPANLDR
jgi:hypothetical protein